ncbi:MAG: DUF4492 domain-containing protein [Arcobacteraceae bacterium]
MINISKIYFFYVDGFRNMKVGKTLWKIIFIKLAFILLFMKYVTHDKNFKSEYITEAEKTQFVYQNLINKNEIRD